MGTTLNARPKQSRSKLGPILAEIQNCLNAHNFERAKTLAEQAVKITDRPDTRLTLATVCLVEGDFQSAEANYLKVLDHRPDHFAAMLGLGQLKLNSGYPLEAIRRLQDALKIRPGNADARHLLARSFGMNRQYDQALELFESLVSENPRTADIWTGYARTLGSVGRADEAVAAYQTAAKLNPNDPMIQQIMAVGYLTVGQLDKAVVHFKAALALRPDIGPPYQELAKLKRLTREEFAEVERLLAKLPSGHPKRVPFLTAITYYSEQTGDYDKAFRSISEANLIRQTTGRSHYDGNAVKAAIDDAVQKIGLADRYEFPVAARTPLFIVGLPRSGSTLTEQILAQHPSVFAAGEWLAMKEVSATMARMGKPYPKGLLELSQNEATELRSLYLSRIPADQSTKAVLTDKMLGNLPHLPLVESLFPEAKVIRCCRHPMDVCWSIFTETFSEVQYDLKIEDICFHMLQYDKMVQAWTARGTLPTLVVVYEELVDRFEKGARSLVDFAGLDWNDNCLTPHQSSRPVLTASVGQVHRPVSTSSVGRWKPFAAHLSYATATLRPLIDRHEAELAKRGIDYGKV